jgi:hypothetical protein
VGDAAEFVVNFGVNGGAMTTMSVGAAGGAGGAAQPAKIAA